MEDIELRPQKEKRNFLSLFSNAEISASGTERLSLGPTYAKFGHNFNTLLILNQDTDNIKLSLDGDDVVVVAGTNGSFSIDWRDNINFNEVLITNLSAVNVIEASNIRITLGRTGKVGGL